MFAEVAVEVQVAAVSAVATVVVGLGVAIIGLLNKRTATRVEERIGTPNGAGNVVQMLERLLAGQAGQDNRLARLEGRQHEQDNRIARVEGRVDVLERRAP